MELNEGLNVNKNFNHTPQETTFTQFVSKIKDRFFTPPKPEADSAIKMKVTKINGDASHMLKSLINVKSCLEKKLDEETYGYVVQMIDPLAQDAKKMNGLVQQASQDHQLENVLERYQKWMAKAKNWIRLEKETGRTEHVVQVIVEHLLGEICDVIDRDIFMIRKYRDQVMQANLSEDDTSFEKVNVILDVHLGALEALKEAKIQSGIEQFDKWKRWVNARRAVLFESALHYLDSLES